MLINAEKTGRLLRRLFNGSTETIISELLQNAQRAGASQIEFERTPVGFTVTDNGSGLQISPDPIVGFNALLRIAESLYCDPNVEENQDPMGVGLGSLLCHEHVKTVKFRSNGYQIEIEPEIWWQSIDETNHWQDLIQTDPTPHQGFIIEVSCHPAMTENMEACLHKHSEYLTHPRFGWESKIGPCQGYAGLLQIYCNGELLEQQSCSPKIPQNLLQFESNYNGCRVKFYVDDRLAEVQSIVVWYGQVIPLSLKLASIGVVMEVFQGKPVNPKAPVREGIIQDDTLNTWKQWLKDTLFNHILKPNAAINSRLLESLSKIDNTRFMQECPFFLASQLGEREPDYYESGYIKEHVLRYDNNPLVLRDDFLITLSEANSLRSREYSQWEVNDAEVTIAENGIDSFAASIDSPAYQLILGNPERLNRKTLHWKCGQQIEETENPFQILFYKPGEWRLEEGDQATDWQPIKNDIYTFGQTDSVLEIMELIFGTTDPIGCLERNYSVAYSEPDEAPELIKEYFGQSVDEAIRHLMKDAIPVKYNQQELEFFARKHFGVDKAEITRVEFINRKPKIFALINGTEESVVTQIYGE